MATCKGAELDRIKLGSRTGPTQSAGASESCTYFDFEDDLGYCNSAATATYGDNGKLIIQSLSGAFEAVNYQIQLEILVNGETGYHGVAWSNEDVAADGFDQSTDACSAASADPVGSAANYEYYRYVGTSLVLVNNFGDIETPHSGQCDIDQTAGTESTATVLLTNASDLSLDATSDFLFIDMPAFNYDLDDVAIDDVVSVVITLIKAPCGVLLEDEIDVGIIGCISAGTTSNTLLFPYFTPMEDADSWWDGLSVVNLAASDVTLTFTVTEMDGDVATTTATVSAGSMFLDTLGNMLSGMTITTPVDGTLGNSDCYVYVVASGTGALSIDGFAMMGYSDGGWGIGYLPRKL
jgi:hypothetical protein